MTTFEEEVFERTKEFDGQFPRPWMTDLEDPLSADCFIVGRNQKRGYQVSEVGSHQRHVDALFNRNGQTCRGLYDSLNPPSPTRKNIDRLSFRLKKNGVRLLETNVICFSSPMSSDLTSSQRRHGTTIFRWLLARVRPHVIVVHGSGAAKELAKLDTSMASVIQMEALAPPEYNKWAGKSEGGRWSRKSEERLDQIAARVVQVLAQDKKAGG